MSAKERIALTFQAGGAMHCIMTRDAGIALRGAKVTVRHYLDGDMDVVFKDRLLPYTTVSRLPREWVIADDKTVDAAVDAVLGRTKPLCRRASIARRHNGTSLLSATRGHLYFGLT